MMNTIFLSYRRDDSAGYSGRLADCLVKVFGDQQVFRDFEDIDPGQNFVESIRSNLSSADVILVLMGDLWLNAKDELGNRRLDNPEDFVRLEIETAIKRNIHIIPILINDAKMPKASDLPASLTALAQHQALNLSDSRWAQDTQQLITYLSTIIRPSIHKSRFRWWGVFTVLLLVVAAAIGYTRMPADFSGQWYFDRGDYLLIIQQGTDVQIEQIDPNMRKVIGRGEGYVEGRTLLFSMEPVYSDRFKYQGRLKKSLNNKVLSGKLIETLADKHFNVRLEKHSPGARLQNE